jgi:hypothetical protein
MPYAKPRITRPLPRQAPRRTPWRAAKPVPAATLTFAQQLGTWGFAVHVYVAWDSVTTAAPAWIEVTEFVDIPATIRINRGRPDAESAPQVGTVALTVDNSDGRWSPANPAGAWYGQIHKGAWLRVDVVPPSQTASTRFVGFIQTLPVSWEGQYAKTMISASDRFVLLGNVPKYQTAIAEEWLNDPVGGPYIIGYWPLHEPSGAAYVSDISGQAPAAQSTLAVKNQGVNAGAGISFGNTSAPGYDGASTVSFTPSGTPTSFYGTPGPYPAGSYLQGAVGPNGVVAVVSCWIQTTSTANQPIWSWTDPASNYGLWCGLLGGTNGSGPLVITQYPLNGVYTTIGNVNSVNFSNSNLADGNWHQVVVKIETAAAYAGTPYAGNGVLQVWIDGSYSFGYLTGGTESIDIVPIATLSRFTLGGAESWQIFNTVYLPAGQVSLFQGSISDLAIEAYPSNVQNPDWYGAYQAGSTMWQSPNLAYSVPESCGRRVIRLAQYAGVPVPVQSFSAFGLGAEDVTTGVTPFINIPAETAHPAGFQQLATQQPLTAMQAAAATENMPLFVDRQGRIVLQPSTLRQNPAPAFTINALDLDKTTTWADDFQYLQNQQVVTPSGQGALTVNTNGVVSQNLLGVYSNSVSTITINALESGSLGAAMNLAGANPAPRHNPLACEVATLTGQAGYGPAFYDAVLAAEISTVVQVTNWPATSASPSSGSYYIEGYAETIGAGTHTFAWNTSPAQGPTYQCDSATLGLCDTPGITLAY